MRDIYYSPRHKQRVQAIERKNSQSWLNENAKLLGVLITLLVLWGLVGTMAFKTLAATPVQATDTTDQLQQQMIQTCEQSYKVINHNLENACGNLIDKVQADNNHEVLHDNNGTFWVETSN